MKEETLTRSLSHHRGWFEYSNWNERERARYTHTHWAPLRTYAGYVDLVPSIMLLLLLLLLWRAFATG